MDLKFVKLHELAELPIRAHEHDAGMDCKAISRKFIDIYDDTQDSLYGDCVKVVYDLGLGVEVPKNHMLIAVPKSGIVKRNLNLTNSIGIIDTGYQGNITVTFNVIKNDNEYCADINKVYNVGDAVIQLILVPIVLCTPCWGEFSEKTERGTGGHGSTGNVFAK